MKKVSIMVPCYNEEENVVPMSEALVAQMEALPQYDYEILFIDNCSQDNTRPLLRQICANNKKIKAILKYVGIDRMVRVIDPKTREDVARPLYEVATTHTARKTFIGNLYKQVKDPNLIASMSGHTDGSRAFARYFYVGFAQFVRLKRQRLRIRLVTYVTLIGLRTSYRTGGRNFADNAFRSVYVVTTYANHIGLTASVTFERTLTAVV